MKYKLTIITKKIQYLIYALKNMFFATYKLTISNISRYGILGILLMIFLYFIK